MWIAFFSVACTSESTPDIERTVLTVSFTAADGEPVPRGSARLSRRNSSGDLDRGGSVLVPAVPEADHGTVTYDDVVVLGVPDGVVAYDVVGFESTGRCEQRMSQQMSDSGQARCYSDEWSGLGVVYVGDHWDPEVLEPGVPQIANGGEGRLEIEVYEGCMCND